MKNKIKFRYRITWRYSDQESFRTTYVDCIRQDIRSAYRSFGKHYDSSLHYFNVKPVVIECVFVGVI